MSETKRRLICDALGCQTENWTTSQHHFSLSQLVSREQISIDNTANGQLTVNFQLLTDGQWSHDLQSLLRLSATGEAHLLTLPESLLTAPGTIQLAASQSGEVVFTWSHLRRPDYLQARRLSDQTLTYHWLLGVQSDAPLPTPPAPAEATGSGQPTAPEATDSGQVVPPTPPTDPEATSAGQPNDPTPVTPDPEASQSGQPTDSPTLPPSQEASQSGTLTPTPEATISGQRTDSGPANSTNPSSISTATSSETKGESGVVLVSVSPIRSVAESTTAQSTLNDNVYNNYRINNNSKDNDKYRIVKTTLTSTNEAAEATPAPTPPPSLAVETDSHQTAESAVLGLTTPPPSWWQGVDWQSGLIIGLTTGGMILLLGGGWWWASQGTLISSGLTRLVQASRRWWWWWVGWRRRDTDPEN